MNRSQKIILTGHRGYIGSALKETLSNLCPADLFTVASDLRDPNQIKDELAPINCGRILILHLAAGTLRAGATYEGYAANCSMLMNLIRATNRFPQRELLFTSSADVFGSNFGLPLTESTPHAPQDWYGLSKSVGEWILRQEKVDHAVFRLPGIFGARVREKSILRQLLFRGLHEGVVSLNARGEALRDFVHIDDLIALILAWLRAPCQGVWNIASGTSSKLSDLVSELRNAWGASFDIALTEEKSARDFDLVFDPSSLRNAFPGVWIKPAAEAFAHYVTALKEMTEESRTLAKV